MKKLDKSVDPVATRCHTVPPANQLGVALDPMVVSMQPAMRIPDVTLPSRFGAELQLESSVALFGAELSPVWLSLGPSFSLSPVWTGIRFGAAERLHPRGAART